MQHTEAELKKQIDALLARAKATDEAEAQEPELDIPAEIERRQARLDAIRQARERLEQRQREADAQRGRSGDDDRQPCQKSAERMGMAIMAFYTSIYSPMVDSKVVDIKEVAATTGAS